MKSAYELAMERFGGEPAKQYTPEQKEQFAEIDREYDAKIAQAKLQAKTERNKAGQHEQIKQIDDALTNEIQSLEAKREAKKEALRRQFA